MPNVNIVAALEAPPPNPRWPPAAGVPQTLCFCSHMLLQLFTKKA